jgi:hypothetical protein
MNGERGTRIALALAGALIAGATLADDDAPKVKEDYTAVAINLNAGPGPSTGRLNIRVRGWSSDEQRSALLKVLADGGSDDLVDALRDQPVVGSFHFTGKLAYDLHYARAFQEGETRHLVLATDRPVGFVELRSMARSLDKGVTILHLALGADGKGTGELLVGAELSLDPESHEITVEHLGARPVALKQVEER